MLIIATPAVANHTLIGLHFGCDASGGLTLTPGDHLLELIGGSASASRFTPRHPGSPIGTSYKTANYVVRCRGGNAFAAQLAVASGDAAKHGLHYSEGTLFAPVTATRFGTRDQTIGYDPLPPNAGTLIPAAVYKVTSNSEPAQFVPIGSKVEEFAFDLDHSTNLPGMRVNNSFGAVPPVEPSPPTVAFLASIIKPLTIVIALALVTVGALAAIDITFNRDSNRKMVHLCVFLAVSLICILAHAPDTIVSNDVLETGRQELLRDRDRLARLMPTTDGILEPISASNFNQIIALAKPRSMVLTPFISSAFFFDMLVAAAFLAYYAMNAVSAGYFLFVRHPASAVVTPALRDAVRSEYRHHAPNAD